MAKLRIVLYGSETEMSELLADIAQLVRGRVVEMELTRDPEPSPDPERKGRGGSVSGSRTSGSGELTYADEPEGNEKFERLRQDVGQQLSGRALDLLLRAGPAGLNSEQMMTGLGVDSRQLGPIISALRRAGERVGLQGDAVVVTITQVQDGRRDSRFASPFARVTDDAAGEVVVVQKASKEKPKAVLPEEIPGL